MSDPVKSRAGRKLQAGGTLVPDEHIYLPRAGVDQHFFSLLAAGDYVNILTSRQMGKSSLVMQALRRLNAAGTRTAYVDLTELGKPETAARYYRGLTRALARRLRIEFDAKTYWDDSDYDTASQHLIDFFRDIVLARTDAPVVICLDEIDSTLKFPYTDDLFLALRAMYNSRGIEPAFARLSFCLVGVAVPNELIKDRRTTPYNIGETLPLRDFDSALDDLSPFIAALPGHDATAAATLERVLHWTGGQPYLTARLCRDLAAAGVKTPEGVDAHIAEAFDRLQRVSTDPHFAYIVTFLDERLTHAAASLALYSDMLDGKQVREEAALSHMELKLSGLVKRANDGRLTVRNRIYERLFNTAWLASTRPMQEEAAKEQERQRLQVQANASSDEAARASSQSRTVAWISAAVVIALLVAYGVYNVLVLVPQRNLAEAQTRLQEAGVAITREEGRFWAFDFPGSYSQTAPQVGDALLAHLVGDIQTVVAASPKLVRLDLLNTAVRNIEPLEPLKNLQWLFLSATQVSDLEPIRNLNNLQWLALAGAPVENIEPVRNLSDLRGLDLSRTQVGNIEPLKNLDSLQWLYLKDTQVSDIEPIRNLNNLRHIVLSGTQVSEQDPVVQALRQRGVEVRF